MSITKWMSAALMGVMVVAISVDDAQAQRPISFVGGVTSTTLTGDDVDDDNFDRKTGFFAAVGTSFGLSDALTLSPYFGYSQKGAAFASSDDEVSLGFIEIPVFLGIGIPLGDGGAGLGLSAGPQFSYLISCDDDEGDCIDDDDLEKLEVGLVGGVSIGFPAGENGEIGFGGGFDVGLTSLVEDLDIKNQGFYFFVAYTIGVGG